MSPTDAIAIGSGYIGSALSPIARVVPTAQLPALDLSAVRTVINSAGFGSDRETDVAAMRAANVDFALRLLSALPAHVRYVHLSTLSVYAPGTIATEDDVPAPDTPYGQTKLEAERAVLARRPDATILRIGTVWGPSPRMRWNTIVHSLVRAARAGLVDVECDGTPLRSLLHTSDLIRAIEVTPAGVWNILSEIASVACIANVVARTFEVPVRFGTGPGRTQIAVNFKYLRQDPSWHMTTLSPPHLRSLPTENASSTPSGGS